MDFLFFLVDTISGVPGTATNVEYRHKNPYIIIIKHCINEENSNSTNHQYLKKNLYGSGLKLWFIESIKISGEN